MTPRLTFRPQAESELIRAKAWYEGQRNGLGMKFLAAVEGALAGIQEYPLAYPRVHGETRRALVPIFPYGIYYRELEEGIIILAVMHGRRLPRRWRSRK